MAAIGESDDSVDTELATIVFATPRAKLLRGKSRTYFGGKKGGACSTENRCAVVRTHKADFALTENMLQKIR
jgi:hypothetical protein